MFSDDEKFVVLSLVDDDGVKNRITSFLFSFASCLLSSPEQKGNIVMLEMVCRIFQLLLFDDDDETIFISLANLLKWIPKDVDNCEEVEMLLLLFSTETIS